MDLLNPGPGLLIWTLLSLAGLLCWIFALISIMKSDFRDTNEKTRWMILVILVPILGAILYFIYGRNSRNVS